MTRPCAHSHQVWSGGANSMANVPPPGVTVKLCCHSPSAVAGSSGRPPRVAVHAGSARSASTTLRCVLPYALEGWLRRALAQHEATLLEATHDEGVTVALQLPQTRAAGLVARLNEAGQGQVVWLPDPDAATGP